MATIRFQIRSDNNPANIYLRLTVDRQINIRRKTGFVIDPNNWSSKTNLPKPNDEDLKKLKNELNNLANTIEKNLNNAISKGEEITGDWLQQQIDTAQGKKKITDIDRLVNYFQYYIDTLPYKEYPSGKKGVTPSTVQKYKTLKNKIADFELYKKKHFYIKDVGLKFRNELVKYFSEVDRLNGNTTGRYIKFLKTVCLDAKKNGIEVNPQLDHIKGFTEKAAKVFLTFNELSKIENAEFKRPALENAKDWLVIGCYIGQRVSDLLKLTSENIKTVKDLKTGKDRQFIELVQQKTGKRVSIPVHSKVKAILDKRNGEFPNRISAPKFNLHIKDVCEIAKIDENTEGGKIDPKTNRKIFGTYPKYELITSHICRRSFATNYYGLIPTSQLIGVTAHATERQFLEYIGKTPDDYAMLLAESWDKLENTAQNKPEMTIKMAK